MKRFIRRLSTCLVLGAVTTVAVAWACAWWSEPRPTSDAHFVHETPPSLARYIQPDDLSIVHDGGSGPFAIRYEPFKHWRAGGFGRRDEALTFFDDWPGFSVNPDRWIYVARTGWPVAAACSVRDSVGDGAHGTRGFLSPFEVERQLDFIFFSATPTAIPMPTLPLWCGIAVDTAFYATPLFALLYGRDSLRRILRRRRGRCLSCPYDLREITSDRCPECGTSKKG